MQRQGTGEQRYKALKKKVLINFFLVLPSGFL